MKCLVCGAPMTRTLVPITGGGSFPVYQCREIACGKNEPASEELTVMICPTCKKPMTLQKVTLAGLHTQRWSCVPCEQSAEALKAIIKPASEEPKHNIRLHGKQHNCSGMDNHVRITTYGQGWLLVINEHDPSIPSDSTIDFYMCHDIHFCPYCGVKLD